MHSLRSSLLPAFTQHRHPPTSPQSPKKKYDDNDTELFQVMAVKNVSDFGYYQNFQNLFRLAFPATINGYNVQRL